MLSSLKAGFNLVRRDKRIAALGLAQSCFEGAMYTFVFMWTPALKSVAETQAEQDGVILAESTSDYLGLIFAVYMICVMIGSSVFKIFAVKKEVIYQMPLILHGVAFCSTALTSVLLPQKDIVYIMFLIFESSVGVFYPSYGVIKSENIPEDIRSAVMNIFRIPLNAFVVLLLLKIKYLSSEIVFQVCTAAHFIALVSYAYFYYTRPSSSNSYALAPQSTPDADL